MRVLSLLTTFALACVAQNLPIDQKAQGDFDKVDAAPRPALRDAMACAQSQAAWISVLKPQQRYIGHYRRAYCQLFGALLSGDSSAFQAAERDFSDAITNWPAKGGSAIPAGLRVLALIARLEGGRAADAHPTIARDLQAAIADPACGPSPVMSTTFCKALIDTARVWIAWLAYRKNNVEEAASALQPLPEVPLSQWFAALEAQRQGRLPDAVALMEKTLKAWTAADRSPVPDVVTLLGLRPDFGSLYYQLGIAQQAMQRHEAAIVSFDEALKSAPRNSHAIYLRAQSKNALGMPGPALEDYALAAQTARSGGDTNWSIGDAYFHRGRLFYRAKDFQRAESEFTAAMSLKLTEAPLTDVTAWRALAVVAGGTCPQGEAVDAFVRATSDGFPKAEADALLADCRLKQATTLDHLVEIWKTYGARVDPARKQAIRNRIADIYADQGVAAEDRKEAGVAVAAYGRALEWNPANTKARFNLGAMYIEDKKFDLAEAEYRALVKADANDHEALYWLGESILAQQPTAARKAEACGLLRRSLAIGDAEKRALYTKALVTARCPAN